MERLGKYKRKLDGGKNLDTQELKDLLGFLEEKESVLGYQVLKSYFEKQLSIYLDKEVQTKGIIELEKKILESKYPMWMGKEGPEREGRELIGSKSEEVVKDRYGSLEGYRQEQSWHKDLIREKIEAGRKLRNQQILAPTSLDLDDWRILCSPMDFLLLKERENISVWPAKSRLNLSVSVAKQARKERKGFWPEKAPIKWKDVDFALEKYGQLIEEAVKEAGKWPEVTDRALHNGQMYAKEELGWI